ncbi:MAG: YggT family protein [Azoarcus sp.]|jgi:YggT family protein|nr:YggT family protein [Azoarcus sp.]
MVNALSSVLHFILQTVFGFVTITLLARFFMQWARVSFRNPIGQFVIAVTDWIVLPVRRVIPSLLGLDIATLLLAWGVQIVFALIEKFRIAKYVDISMMTLLLLSLIGLAHMAVYFVTGIVLIAVILSWVGPQNPAAFIFSELARPFLAPFRRLIKPIGGLDISPLVLFVVLQIIQLLLFNLRQSLLPSFIPGL